MFHRDALCYIIPLAYITAVKDRPAVKLIIHLMYIYISNELLIDNAR